MTNLFFDPGQLAHCGKNVIIGKTVRIRYPELVSIGDNCIIDDFTYISTAMELSDYTHVSSGSKFIGGKNSKVVMREFSTTAPNAVLSAGSDDYMDGIATPLVPSEYKGNVEYGTIELGRHSIVGAGSVVMPAVTFGEGAAVGALSLVKRDLEPWTLYAGIPARKLKRRNEAQIKRLEQQFRDNHSQRQGIAK